MVMRALTRKPRLLTAEELRRLYDRTRVAETVATVEAAALMKYTQQTLRRWACHGDGPIRPCRINGRLRWSVAEIRALLGSGAT
jgi:hypothetical protein